MERFPRDEPTHFATHGLLDERFPLNSGIALTIPETPAEGEDNGLLQAWEIFEQVRIDADLVTLSASVSEWIAFGPSAKMTSFQSGAT